MRQKNGFTMIELMIVIIIIGMLAVLGGGAYFTSLRKGRDAKRIADIKAIQKGFEMVYARDDHYNDCEVMQQDSTIFTVGVPVDPTGSPYETSTIGTSGACDNTTYCVCALLERSQFANSGQYCDFAAGTKNYFCARNMQ